MKKYEYYRIDTKYDKMILESWVYINKKGVKRIKTYKSDGSGFIEIKYYNFDDLDYRDQLFWTNKY